MPDKYPQRVEFRLKLMALKISPSYARKSGAIVAPKYFETSMEQNIASAIDAYIATYNKLPNDPEDIIELCDHDDNTVDLVYDVYDMMYDTDLELAHDIAVQWAKEQSAKIAILESVDDVKRGNLAAVVARLEEALKIGDEALSPGIDVVKDVSHWLYDQWFDKIPTGLIHLDTHLDGGLGVGELGCWLAPTNRGKSTALMNIAYGAAGLLSKKNVVIFTHEMRPKIYAKRFGARLMFRFPSKYEDLSVYEDDFIEAARLLMPGNVRIIGGARKMTTVEIETDIKRLIDEGFKPDLLIDDYGDLVIPPRNYNERRFELTSVYEWFRDIGGRYGFPIWTASQVGRSAYNKEIITEADVAEDIGKVNTADVVVAQCQTDEELQNNLCRLYLAKARDAKRGAMFDAKLFMDSQALVTIGVTKPREFADA